MPVQRGVELGAKVVDEIGVGGGGEFGVGVVGLEGLKDFGGVVDEVQHGG